MIYDGRLIRIGNVLLDEDFGRQTSCKVTVGRSFTRVAGKLLSNRHVAGKKTWSVSGTCLLTRESVRQVVPLLERDDAMLKIYSTDRRCYLSGSVIFTKVSFAGQGRSVVRLSFTAQGTGRLYMD